MQSMYVASTLGLVLALDELGLSAEAGRLEAQLGGVAAATEQEEAKAKEQVGPGRLHARCGMRVCHALSVDSMPNVNCTH